MGATGKYTWGGDRRSTSFHAERQRRKAEDQGLSRLTVTENRNRKSDDTEYHQFPDKARDTHEYYGDGRDAVDFFNTHSNYDELIGQMSDSERDAFEHTWCPGRFMSGQQYKGFENMTPSEQRATRVFDKYLDKSEINAPFTVYRKAGYGLINNGKSTPMSMNEIKALIGRDVYSAGSMSCGAAQEGLTIGAYGKIEYKINFPAGKGMGMWIGDRRINFWGSKQREFMTNRDTVYTVRGVTKKSDGTFVVELDYKLRLSHNYGGKVTSKDLGY